MINYIYIKYLNYERDAIQGQILAQYSWFKFRYFLLVD